jgi:UDP-N-acetyl-D-mannosaminuronic acid transferase (WecB/TagA/CpsF family)
MSKVFDINFSAITEKDYFKFIEHWIGTRELVYVVTPNLHFARLAQIDQEFKRILNLATLRLCDSAVLSAVMKIKRHSRAAAFDGIRYNSKAFGVGGGKGI